MSFIGKRIEEMFNDDKFTIDISKDYMYAYLTVEAKNGLKVSRDDLIFVLRKNKIQFGIVPENIDKIIYESILNKPVEIAKGLKPINGENASIKYLFSTKNELKPKIDDNGKIDFRELGFVSCVNAGEPIALIIPPTSGTDGKNVFGEDIKAIEGRKLQLRLGRNVELSNDESKVIAKCSGKPDLIDSKIDIVTLLEIKNDIDASTGNIKFIGDVHINGDIKAGYSLYCEGNVIVSGVVEASNINIKGNLFVKSGIQGNGRESIYVSGSLTAKYIENSVIFCGDDIITDFIVHSNIVCMNSVRLIGKKALISGGEIRAKNEIKANIIGSHMGTKTHLEVGIDPKLKHSLKEYQIEKIDIEKKLFEMGPSINSYKELIKRGQVSEKVKIEFTKLANKYSELNARLVELKNLISEADDTLLNSNEGTIIVTSKLYPGVKIDVGCFTQYIREETNGTKFCIIDSQLRALQI